MKASLSILTTLATSLMLAGAAQAQATADKAAAKPSQPAAKAPVKKAAPAEAQLAKADANQMNAATLTHMGDYACEFNQTVKVAASVMNEGYVDLRYKSQSWTMKPVLSSTGALRLEDVKGRMLMLQIANKSMLMDTKLGQRVVDDCVHEKQRAAANAARS